MKFELFEEEVSGSQTRIYSPVLDGEVKTLYEKFVEENRLMHKKEVDNIDDRLYAIGHDCGLFEEFFKTAAGEFGENLCHINDRPGGKLRLYFIEDGLKTMILGSGGLKPKTARTTQEAPDLYHQNRIIGTISTILHKAKKAGHFDVNEDGTIFSTTNFVYNSDDYE